MGAIKTGWDFFQDQILGMHWLKDLIGNLLVKAGMGESRFPGEFLHFFIYDVIKIFVLLAVLIFLISYIQSYFPPERSKKIPWYLGEYYRSIAWNGDTVLLLFFNPDLYGIYKCGTSTWSDVFVSHIFSNGGFRIAGVAYECVRWKNCICICDCGTDRGSSRRNVD